MENEKVQVSLNQTEKFDNVINEIETLLDTGFKLPPFGAVVSAKEVRNQLEILRKAVKEAVEEAEHVMNIKEQLLNDARLEAEEIVRRRQLEVAKQPVLKDAEMYAKKMFTEAKKQTEQMKREAEDFQRVIKERTMQFADSIFNEVDKGLNENRKKVSRNRQDLKLMLDGAMEGIANEQQPQQKEEMPQQRKYS